MTHRDPPPLNRRREILDLALREQALARHGRRVVGLAVATAAVLVASAAVVFHMLPPTTPAHSPSLASNGGATDRASSDAVASPSPPAPDGSATTPRVEGQEHRLASSAPERRMIVERIRTTPGIAERLAVSTASSDVARATDDDLVAVLRASDPSAGLLRIGGQVYATSRDTIVRPEEFVTRTPAGAPHSLLPTPAAGFGI